MKSVMKHQFSQIPQANIPRSIFNRTHGYKTTFDEGYLIPFYVDEALPGDTFNLNATLFARLATPIVPIMDNMKMDVFYFAVPMRLLWTNFTKMLGEQTDPGDSTSFVFPVIESPAVTGWAVGTLSDYFGLPTGIVGLEVNSLWHRAYNKIYNEWFRDENIQDSVVVDTDNGPDTDGDYVLLRSGKAHDYFTSALPWPQKGTAVPFLAGDAWVKGIGKENGTYPLGPVSAYESPGGAAATYTNAATIEDAVNTIWYVKGDAALNASPQIYADLSSSTDDTINSLRTAFQLQKLLEKDARGGTRYQEIVLSHFGVYFPDRAWKSEYLGGNSAPVNVFPVPQTSETSGTPQGTLSGYGTVSCRAGFTKSFVEHCCLMGILRVRADLTYQQGIPKMFCRSTRYDLYWPTLAHLGEQTVLNKEIYAQATSADEEAFAYQERYAEYRYFPSKITGELRSTYATPLDMWHLSQEFGALPTLSPTFIVEDAPMSRVIATPTEPHFILDSYIQMNCARPMPVYSVPGLIDHF